MKNRHRDLWLVPFERKKLAFLATNFQKCVLQLKKGKTSSNYQKLIFFTPQNQTTVKPRNNGCQGTNKFGPL